MDEPQTLTVFGTFTPLDCSSYIANLVPREKSLGMGHPITLVDLADDPYCLHNGLCIVLQRMAHLRRLTLLLAFQLWPGQEIYACRSAWRSARLCVVLTLVSCKRMTSLLYIGLQACAIFVYRVICRVSIQSCATVLISQCCIWALTTGLNNRAVKPTGIDAT